MLDINILMEHDNCIIENIQIYLTLAVVRCVETISTILKLISPLRKIVHTMK